MQYNKHSRHREVTLVYDPMPITRDNHVFGIEAVMN